jgi:hypothetical protein
MKENHVSYLQLLVGGCCRQPSYPLETMAGTHTTKAQWWLGVLGCQTRQHSYAGKIRVAIDDFPKHAMCSSLERQIFPQSSLYDSQNKKSSSHTWREILVGHKALGCSLIRRISDNETTNIWRDRWIPSAIGGRPICLLPGALSTWVCELLVADGVNRNSQALQENLFPMGTQAVKRILLVRCQGDFWA